jgi:hypothetical protein
MQKSRRFVVYIFPDANDLNTENGNNAMKCAEKPDEIASFDSWQMAKTEMRERHIDYGALAQIFDLDTGTVVCETTDDGRTWHEPAHAPKSAEPVPA